MWTLFALGIVPVVAVLAVGVVLFSIMRVLQDAA
jgi:hypothetical protein